MSVELASNIYPASYLLAFLTPFFVNVYFRFGKSGPIRAVSCAVVSAVFMATLVIAGWQSLVLALADHLGTLDRNGDTFWTEEEQNTWSESDWRYYNMAMSDGGRNVFSVFVFPIFSLIYSSAIAGSFSLFRWWKNKNA